MSKLQLILFYDRTNDRGGRKPSILQLKGGKKMLFWFSQLDLNLGSKVIEMIQQEN